VGAGLFIFPFALMTLFLLLDRALARVPGTVPRRAVAFLAALVALSSVVVQWRRLHMPASQLFTNEIGVLRAELPAIEAVYVDGFSVIPFFTHHQDWEWRSMGRAADGRLRLIRFGKEERSFVVINDLTRWNPAGGDGPCRTRSRCAARSGWA